MFWGGFAQAIDPSIYPVLLRTQEPRGSGRRGALDSCFRRNTRPLESWVRNDSEDADAIAPLPRERKRRLAACRLPQLGEGLRAIVRAHPSPTPAKRCAPSLRILSPWERGNRSQITRGNTHFSRHPGLDPTTVRDFFAVLDCTAAKSWGICQDCVVET